MQRAEQAELLLAQAQVSHEEQLRSARLEESARIARDIHDVLAHTLAGLVIQLEATDALLGQGVDTESIRERVQRAHALAREGLQETRRAVGALRGNPPDPAPAVIRALIEQYDSPIEFTVTGDEGRLDGQVGEAVLRVIQEGLTNVRKHAAGAEVTVAVVIQDDQLCVTVENRVLVSVAPSGLAAAGGGYGDCAVHARACRPVGGHARCGSDRGRLVRGTASAAGFADGGTGSATMSGMIRVLVTDDQALVREGLMTLLETAAGIEPVAAARDGEEAVALCAQHRPDVVLMDLRMPNMDGVEATRRIHAEQPDVEVVVLTTHADEASILDALSAGARGYLTKDAGIAEISRAVHAAAAHQTLLDPVVQQQLLAAATARPASAPQAVEAGGNATTPATLPDELTPREAEVLSLIARGLSNSEIATELFVSEATVKTHINHVFSKIDARDRAQAVHYAYTHGLAG